MLLLEGLIAMLIFTIGVLGVVGMQATVVKQVTDAKYRTDAGMLANQLIGTMWVSDRTTATLQSNFNTGGAAYNTWLAKVSTTLPGVAMYPPTVAVSNQGVTTVTIRWLAPSEAANTTPHQHVVIAQIQ
ncbi:MAG: Type fimbrial biosis protein PilV [Pseudomonadota bacterium]